MVLLMKSLFSPSKRLLCFYFYFYLYSVVVLFWCNQSVNAQNATTDPSEVRALNSIFQQWGVQALPDSFNTTGYLCSCSGVAIRPKCSAVYSRCIKKPHTVSLEQAPPDSLNTTGDPCPCSGVAIRSNCSFDNNTVCHITHLKLVGLNKQGMIQEELLDLPFLEYLKIDGNFFSGPLPAFIGNMSRLGFLSIAVNNFSGPIPKELGNLKELYHLSVANNNFSGTLPPELGNLVNLQNLSLFRNSFSGALPRELGNLVNLQHLAFSYNNFSGALPRKLGNLVNLQNLYIGSSGLGGEIPSTFANLKALREVWVNDNQFTGNIDFVDTWTNLTELHFINNSFSGTLPPKLGNLVNLQQLSLNMNNFSGILPPELGNLVNLRILEISFNKLSGSIPKELRNLTELYYMDFGVNSFSGTLPPELGHLLNLQYLAISFNKLSGPFPKELGNLKELNHLDFGVNNFFGTLPPELSNLVNLRYLYIDSSGLGGEIPSTFANLTNLQLVWASDNSFTGKIPDFIGNNWTKLTQLYLQGNSFHGPIPSSFANLTSLTTLRISCIYNGSSSLDFIRNLKNLNALVLRNVMLTGVLPTYIAELKSLQTLDLSFNNLTGTIPRELLNMGSLKHLLLGSNSLSGGIPDKPNDSELQTIDLSYNLLSGDLPSWVDGQIQQLNLVGNNFTRNNANIRLLSGLECLQKSFPCNRDAPRYASFAINCGGPEMIFNGIVFEADNRTLGAATYAITSTQKWAVSNTGMFAGISNAQYVENYTGQVRGTNTPELYQTSRLSPGSLRYYGLGLENGLYTVNLCFAEMPFPYKIRRGLASRVFDVYIQGNRRLRDFDILKEAGGIGRAIAKNFTANVTGNHLEIHLFWPGKGTCSIPEQGYCGPSISAISVTPNFRPTVSGLPPKEKNHIALIASVTVPVVGLALILIFVILYVKRKREDEEEVLLGICTRLNKFSYSELKAATEDFNSSNKLGQGGFGAVYKGTFSDGRVVAVKQLSIASNHGKSQFIAEVATISAVQHRNLVKLHGYCIEGKRNLLVYEYLENKSLDRALFGCSNLHLDWPTRYNICLETARGLAYLHEESRPRIVHRDIKASNILLDAELCPKISDFGLAKLYDDQKTHISTRVAGTIGYLAPEYAMRGHLTEKADVFGFGIVALEIISGRPNSDNSLDDDKIYLLGWAWSLHENNRSLDLVDPKLTEFDEDEALRMVRVAFLCAQGSPSMRPPMSRVVAMLAGDIEVSGEITRPSYLTDWDLTGRAVTGDAEGPAAATILSAVNDSEFSVITAGR